MATFSVSLVQENPGLGSATLNPSTTEKLSDAFSCVRGELVTFLTFPTTSGGSGVSDRSTGGVAIF